MQTDTRSSHSHFWSRTALALLVAGSFGSCTGGWKIGWPDINPPQRAPLVYGDKYETVHIPVLKNETLQYGTEENLTAALIDHILNDGRLTVSRRENADLILEGVITKMEQSPLAYDDRDRAVAFNLFIQVTMRLVEPYNVNDLEAVPTMVAGPRTYTGPVAGTRRSDLQQVFRRLVTSRMAAAKKPPPIVVVRGNDLFVFEELIQRAVAKCGGPDACECHRFDANHGELCQAVETANSPSLLSPQMVIAITNLEKVDKKDLPRLQRYLERPEPTVKMILQVKAGRSIKKDLLRLIEDCHTVDPKKERARAIERAIGQAAAEFEVEFDRGALAYLREAFSREQETCRMELEKLALYAGPKGVVTASSLWPKPTRRSGASAAPSENATPHRHCGSCTISWRKATNRSPSWGFSSRCTEIYGWSSSSNSGKCLGRDGRRSQGQKHGL